MSWLSNWSAPLHGLPTQDDPVVGITRLARVMRVRWRPVLLGTGALLVIIGIVLPSGGVFVPGLLVLLVAVLTEAEPSYCPAAGQMTAAHWSG